jgi:hypothetical protein
MPHPNFVPVIPSTSRSTHNSGMSRSTSTVWALPFMVIVSAIAPSEIEANSARGLPASIAEWVATC